MMRSLTLLALMLALAGCSVIQPLLSSKPSPPPPGLALTAPPPDPHQMMVDLRKEEVLKKLATCESGDWGPSEKPIYGGRGLYLGRFQFTIRTIQGFVMQMDGRALTIKEATNLAHDWDQALALAKYAIFDLDGIGHWPLCARKLNLRAEIAAIRQL